MSWTDGADLATGTLVTGTIWNNYNGAAGSLMVVKSHAHGGATGEGSQSIGPLVLEDFTDAAAPAAPGAGKTRVYAVSGRPRFRAGAAGADLELFGMVGSDADGDIYYRASGALARLAKGTASQVLAMNGGATAPVWSAPGASLLDKKVTDTTVVNTVTETDIYRKTVSGNTMGANGVLRLTLFGTSLDNSGNAHARQFRVKFGATTLFDSGTATLPFGATRQQWRLDVLVWNAAATGTQRAAAWLFINTNSGAGFVWFATNGTSGPHMALGSEGAASEDTTANKDLAVTVQLGLANASFDVVSKEGVLELFT